MLLIRLNSRIHISLLSMHDSPYRINGGIGLSTSNPSCTLSISPSATNQIFTQNLAQTSLPKLLTYFLNEICLRENFNICASITLSGNIPIHSGFGSGTAIKLACVEALFIINDRKYTQKKIILLSGRGGTSGVGVQTYFNGGFIFDLGHLSNIDSSLRPSHIGERGSPPLLLGRYSMPKWEMGICIPKALTPLSHTQERDFFSRTCPLPDKDVHETTYHALFGVLSSILDKDYLSYCRAINNIQKCTWKHSERSLHGKILLQAEDSLKSCGADAVGMSSLGPGLYFYSENIKKLLTQIDTEKYTIFESSAANKGRVISYV